VPVSILIQDELLEIKSFSSPAVAVLTVLEQSPTLSCSRSKTDRQSFPFSQRMATMPSVWLQSVACSIELLVLEMLLRY